MDRILFAVSMSMIFAGMLALLVGFHNIDLAWNARTFIEYYDGNVTNWYDTSISGMTMSVDEMYKMGSTLILLSPIGILFGGIGVAFSATTKE